MKTEVKSHDFERNKHFSTFFVYKIKEFIYTASKDVALIFSYLRDMMGVKRIRDIFKPVRETPRTYCNVFQTYISHKINHVSKRSATPFLKR